MPLVFVHGVNVRKDANYVVNEEARNGLFRKYALSAMASDPSQVTIENPYWGEFGAAPAWNGGSLPDDKYENFGEADSVFEEILTDLAWDIQAQAPDKVLLTLANKSLERAVDCLWTAGAYTDSGAPVGAALANLSEKALMYARENPKPAWLDQVKDDDKFVEKLLTEVGAWKKPAQSSVESFGISDVWNHLKTAAGQLAQRGEAFIINPLVRTVRPWVNAKITIFLGDVFVYLKTRSEDNGGQIVGEVLNAFRRADKARNANDSKLIIVAHSMGGNITYDILTSFEPDLHVDLFLTVGSQVGMFEELKLFRASNPSVKAPATVPMPKNVERWINVMDLNDILAYSTGKIFARSKDTKFDNQAPVWSAHSTYFSRPFFHERLHQRILE
jgi:hypothetical protein